MSYGLAQTFLRDAFPAGQPLPASSLKVNTRRIGQRLEAETLAAVEAIVRASRRAGNEQSPAPQGPAVALKVDGGYIRAVPKREGVFYETAARQSSMQ